MKKNLIAGIASFVFLTLLPAAAAAETRFDPGTLACPSTSQGQPVDCGSFVLKNHNAVLSVEIGSVSIGDTKNFTLDASGCTGKTLQAGGSCPLIVTFLAKGGGAFSTSAKASYKLWGHPKTRYVSANIGGVATYPIVRLSTSAVAFGDQTIGTSHDRFVRMDNIGTGTLNISGMRLPFGSAFRVDDDCGDTLPPLEHCDIVVFFEPAQAIDYAATLEIDDDAHDSPQQIRLTGKGIDPGHADVNISRTSIDFGSLTLASEAETIVTLTSTGTVDLTIASISAPTAPFSRTTDCPIAPATLAPGERCAVTVKFKPEAVGAYSATINVVDDATDSPQAIELKGKGVSPNATLVPALLDFGYQTIGKQSLRQEVTLLNSGTSELSITDISTSSSVFVQSNSCAATLKPKKLCVINVLFAPTETGIVSGWLTVATND
ncbi:MAG TPA: choice-of-anchor D domain-containing protein, partial [bacterium]|nr:choice-of-anchor D domain-containing protein [bacterium]